MVKGKYTSTFHEILATAPQLNFGGIGWKDKEAEALALCLPFCKELSALYLFNNKIGPKGGAALAAQIGKCPKLTFVSMGGHQHIGEIAVKEFREWESSAPLGVQRHFICRY